MAAPAAWTGKAAGKQMSEDKSIESYRLHSDMTTIFGFNWVSATTQAEQGPLQRMQSLSI